MILCQRRVWDFGVWKHQKSPIWAGKIRLQVSAKRTEDGTLCHIIQEGSYTFQNQVFQCLSQSEVDLTKLLATVLCLGEPPESFCNVGCCCCFFPHWRFVRFRATFSCHRHSILDSQAREGLQQLWALPWLLLVALLLPGLSVTVLPRALRFWLGIFYPEVFFYLALLFHIFDTFCDSDARRNTPFRILLCASLHRVVLSSWRMYLNCSYCSYKTIDLSIATVIHEV